MYYPAPGVADVLRRRMLGVELAETRPRLVRARAGVVLSTGGFIFNREMVARHAPKYLRNFRLGTSGCDGSGIRLGQSAGENARGSSACRRGASSILRWRGRGG